MTNPTPLTTEQLQQQLDEERRNREAAERELERLRSQNPPQVPQPVPPAAPPAPAPAPQLPQPQRAPMSWGSILAIVFGLLFVGCLVWHFWPQIMATRPTQGATRTFVAEDGTIMVAVPATPTEEPTLTPTSTPIQMNITNFENGMFKVHEDGLAFATYSPTPEPTATLKSEDAAQPGATATLEPMGTNPAPTPNTTPPTPTVTPDLRLGGSEEAANPFGG